MTDIQLAAQLFLQIGVIVLVCRIVGWFGRMVGQPQVVSEMVAGFLMGPSLLGWLMPGLHAQLFPPATLRILFVVSQLGLVLYMFCVGLEFRPDLMIRHARRAAAVSIAGIAFPFALGAAVTFLLIDHGGFFGAQVGTLHAVLFVGAAMSITAFPVLARIIHERGIAGTTLGTLTLAAGAIDDAAAWIILAVVLASFTGSTLLAVGAAGGAVVYVAAVLLGARPLLGLVNSLAERQGSVAPWMIGSTLTALAFGAWFTDVVGIYSVFGAFVLGASIPRGLLTRELQRGIEPLTTAWLLPLFFAYAGINSHIGLLDSPWLWLVTGLVFVVACAGKGLACWAAARATGATPRDALGIATLMNARGLMELVLLTIGLQRGLITPMLFTIFAMMAIATTLMTGPLFEWLYRREPAAAPDARMAWEDLS